MEYLDTASSMDRKFTFSPEEIKVVQDALKTKLYEDEDPEVKQAKWVRLLHSLCAAFHIPEVSLHFADASRRGYGGFDQSSNTITVGKRYSLATLLHFFFVALINAKREDAEFLAMIRSTGMHPAELCSAFSYSLFRESAPDMYENAKANGRLLNLSTAPAPRRRQTGPSFPEDDDKPEPEPGSLKPDIDPENRVDRGNGPGED